jgi:hypothetical protein
MDMSGELHAPAALLPGKNFGAHLIGGWVAPKDSLDGFGNEKILNPYRDLNFGPSGL